MLNFANIYNLIYFTTHQPMKVMKFGGGTSVGTIENLRNVKAIVERCDEPVVVVVGRRLAASRLQLIATARLATAGDMPHLEATPHRRTAPPGD